MKINLKIISIAVVGAMLVLTGCNTMTRLYKEQDYDKMYKAAMDFYDKGSQTKKKIHFNRAIQLFENIAMAYTGTTREDSIKFYTASAYYRTGDYITSGMLFDNFRYMYPRSVFIEQAEYLYVMGYYNAAPEPTRDQTYTQQAIIAIDEFLDRYPKTMYKEYCLLCRDELMGLLYEQAYLNAKTYYKIGKYRSAIVACRNAVTRFPFSPHREDLMFMTLDSSYQYAKNSIPSKQKDRYLNMLDYYYNFVSEFPDSSHRAVADKMMASAREYLRLQERIEGFAE